MGGLAHYIEGQGIATTLIGLIPQHVHGTQPPRALLVPFELGRPLGEPNQPELQTSVLRQALSLADESRAYVHRWFEGEWSPQQAADQLDDGWACPVSFASDEASDPLSAEVAALQPWFDRHQAEGGRSVYGLTGLAIVEVVDSLLALEAQTLPEAPNGWTNYDWVKALVEDFKMFYVESGVAQPGTPTTQDISNWFWEQSEGGRFVRRLVDAIEALPEVDPLLQQAARRTMIPAARA